MSKILSFTFIFYLFLFTSLFSQSDQDTSVSDISLRTFVENESIALNREVVYVVELKWEGELSRYQIIEVLDPDVTNLIMRGSGSSNKVVTNTAGQEVSIKRITFYFKPIEMGMSYINGVTVRYKDIILEKDESLIASRIGVQILEPIPDSSSNGIFDYFIYLFIALIVGLTLYLFYIYNKRKKENELKDLENISESSEEKYLRLLKENIQLTGNNYKDKLNNLAHLIIGYFSEKYSNQLSNKSSEEILVFLEQKRLENNIYSKFKEFITQTDLIRFAGNKVDETDFHNFYDTVEWILEKCKNEISERED